MKHIAIFGPTAVGKTSLSVKLAKHLNSEIISADSAQIYKKMNIGTAKVTKQEMKGIKHHMLDLINPGEYFDVAKFNDFSSDILKRLDSEEKQGIVVGGTGMYIKALTDGLISLPSDNNLRKKLEKEDPQVLHDRLQEIDPDYAKKTPPNNIRRVIRALEVYELTGNPFSYAHSFTKSNFDFYKFGLIKNRDKLYDDINKRTDIMIEQGLLEEAKEIFEEFKKKIDKINVIGYNELFQYFKNEITLNEAIELIKQNSRNYAKRQITWLKANDYEIIDVDKKNALEYILKFIKS